MSPKVRGGDGASLTGFEAFQATLKKILSRMDGNLSLNERWHTLGTYLDGYCYDKDIQNLSQKCAEVCTAVRYLEEPCAPPCSAVCLCTYLRSTYARTPCRS